MTYNVEMVSESVTNVVTMMVRDVLTIVAAATVMLYQSPRLTAFVAIVLPLIAMMIRVLAKAFRR
jgi:subfamily B ATP-binding cassette protein MsbA